MRDWIDFVLYHPQSFALFDLVLHIFSVPHNH